MAEHVVEKRSSPNGRLEADRQKETKEKGTGNILQNHTPTDLLPNVSITSQ
jgi:hypothetical protein